MTYIYQAKIESDVEDFARDNLGLFSSLDKAIAALQEHCELWNVDDRDRITVEDWKHMCFMSKLPSCLKREHYRGSFLVWQAVETEELADKLECDLGRNKIIWATVERHRVQ